MTSAPMTGELGYLHMLKDVLEKGDRREGRNGVTRSLFGRMLRFDLQQGFPLLTTKRVPFKAIVVELLWFLRGDTNVRWLQERGVTIWDEWADENGDLGPVYGAQWRRWEGKAVSSYGQGPLDDGPSLVTFTPLIDQIAQVIKSLKTDPFSRRHIVNAWNVGDIDQMALPPCHCMFQFHVVERDGMKWLSCHLTQRSADVFLGVPFNIASYALLTMMVAKVTKMLPYELVVSYGDYHLYENHIEQAVTQLQRTPARRPTVELFGKDVIDGWDLDDFVLRDYHPADAISAPVSA